MKNIIICAAKTGGHIFPALGFAKEALKNDYKITFLGTNTDLEKKIFQKNENIYFLEINTLPGMTETSLFPMAAKRHGFSFKDIINNIIKLSLQK
mgnify:CR=1 FL=1